MKISLYKRVKLRILLFIYIRLLQLREMILYYGLNPFSNWKMYRSAQKTGFRGLSHLTKENEGIEVNIPDLGRIPRLPKRDYKYYINLYGGNNHG